MNPKLSRRKFISSTLVGAGALASVTTSPASGESPRRLAARSNHHIPMPGSGLYSVSFSTRIDSAIPCNLTGNGLTDWVAKHEFFRKDDIFKIEARDHHGKFLWEFDSGLDGHRMTHASHVPVTVWDFDSDGRDEVVTMMLGPTARPPMRAHLVALDGLTGKIKAMTPIPWAGGAGNSRFNHGTTRSYATVAYLDGPDRPPSYIFHLGTYIDGACWAFDIVDGQFQERWAYQHAFHLGTGHHGLTAFDINGDGRDEILMGGTVIDADGCQIFSWTEKANYGHVDFVIPGVIDPDKPGVQLLFGFEYGYGVALTSADGEVYWHNKEAYHAHSGWVAKVRPDLPGEQIRMRSKLFSETWHHGTPPDVPYDTERTEPWNGLLDARGNRIEIGEFQATRRPPDWNGDGLHVSWDKVIEELGIQGKSNSLVGVDLGGGDEHGAEEILRIFEDTAFVHFNRNARPEKSKWANTNYRRMAVSSLGSGYRNYDSYRVWNPQPKLLPPTAQIRIDGQRNIGIRRQKSVNAVREINGARFVLFRDENHRFVGDRSWDSRGRAIHAYEWDWDDGTRSHQANPLKRFDKCGVYQVSLTVRSGTRVARETITVEVQNEVVDYVARLPHSISIRDFQKGSRLYIDQDFQAKSVPPELVGMTLIQTHHDIEHLRGGLLFSWDVTDLATPYISFRVPIEMNVYVAMDEYMKDEPAFCLYEYYRHPTPDGEPREKTYWPQWLARDRWQPTDHIVINSRNNRPHRLYKKSFRPAEHVWLGPNRYMKTGVVDWDRNMYFVLIETAPRKWINEFYERRI